MLWRQEYGTRVAEGILLPEVTGELLNGEPWRSDDWEIVLGGFSTLALRQLEVWWRLVGSAGLESSAGLLLFTTERPEAVAALLPPSRHAKCALVHGGETWRDLIHPSRADEAFAYSRGEGLLMVGLATEDAWERFEAASRRR